MKSLSSLESVIWFVKTAFSSGNHSNLPCLGNKLQGLKLFTQHTIINLFIDIITHPWSCWRKPGPLKWECKGLSHCIGWLARGFGKVPEYRKPDRGLSNICLDFFWSRLIWWQARWEWGGGFNVRLLRSFLYIGQYFKCNFTLPLNINCIPQTCAQEEQLYYDTSSGSFQN